ncbi:MAG: hypothetical protein LBJ03_00575 [Holosporales bacterium]|jgi:hypothetical protein|nr:hypothetical protein [Holosporales bacterium]
MNGSEKQKQLIKYLLKIANINGKTVKNLDEYERVFWLYDVPRERDCFSKTWVDESGKDKDEWMEMQSQSEPATPEIPSICQNWVELDLLKDKLNGPKLLNKAIIRIEVKDEETGIKSCKEAEEKLEDRPDVQKEWNNYLKNHWNNWTQRHNEWEKLQKLYGELYSIHQSLLKSEEEYELVLGVGLLAFKDKEGKIFKRHLIVADVELKLNPENSRLTLTASSEGCHIRIDSNMFESGLSRKVEEDVNGILEEIGDNPFDLDNVEKCLKIILNSTFSDGEYKRQFEPIKKSEKPIITFAPAVILRKRSIRGLTDTLKNMERQIDDNTEVPGIFANLVDIRSHNCGENNEDSFVVPSDEMIFFPKPCNEEQKAIIQKINRANGVLVQGPPGTALENLIP